MTLYGAYDQPLRTTSISHVRGASEQGVGFYNLGELDDPLTQQLLLLGGVAVLVGVVIWKKTRKK